MPVTSYWSWLVCLSVIVSLSDGQNAEKGVVITVQSTSFGHSVHLRHLGVNPPYDNITGRVTVPGLRFSIPDMHFLSVEVDYRQKELFLYDVHLKTVFIGVNYNAPLKLQDTNMTFFAMHVGVSSGAVQLAYDWLSRTLYWVDSVFKWIVATPGSVDKLDMDYFKIVVNGNLDHPEGITVDPIAGYMFFSDNGLVPKIERAMLDGSGRKVLTDITGLSTPESLEVDIFDKRLYIIDTRGEKIISVNYEGKDQRLVRRFSNSILADLAIYRESLYVTNVRAGSMYIVNKTSGLFLIDPIALTRESIYGLAIYKEEVQPLKPNAITNCTALACHHMCFSTNNSSKCMCSEGYQLNTTTNLCDEVAGKFHRALVIANTTHICLADIRSVSSYSSSYDLNCVYSVLPQPVTTTTTTTTTPVPTTTPKSTTTILPSAATTTTTTTMITHDMHASSTPKTTVPTTVPTSTRPTTRMPSTSGTSTPASSGSRRRKRQAPASTPTTASTTLQPTMSPMEPKMTIVQFDLDMIERIFYFAMNDSSIHSRPIDLSIQEDQTNQLVISSGKISGLAFDWVNMDNLYWCESDTGAIYMVNVKTQAVRQLISSLNSPSDLHILAHESKLVLASMGMNATTYSIYTLDMTGGNLKEIVQGRKNITSITVDQEKRMIYWTEAGSVYSTDFQGSAEPVFVSAADSDQADLLVLYKNYLVWTKPGDGGTMLESYIVDTERQGNKWQFDNITKFVDMRVLDATEQPAEPQNPCAFRNGECEQLCVTVMVNDKAQKKCECALGFDVQSDGLSCEAADTVDDEFAIVTDWLNDRMYQIALKTNNITALHFEDQTTYFGVFYNKLTGMVVWSELNSPIIYASYLNGTNKIELVDNGVGQVEKFALDETTGNLFYTINDYPNSAKIGVLSPRGEQRYLSLDKTFQQTYFFSGIDVHPQQGLLYFTASSYFYDSKIVTANMDGTNVKLLTIPAQQTFTMPEGIAVDHVNEKLYWSDYYQDEIYRCDLDGGNCVSFTKKLAGDIKDIATDSEFLYYTAWNTHHLTQVRLTDPTDITPVGSNFELGRLETVSVYRSSMPNTQKRVDTCSTGWDPVSMANTICQKRKGKGPCSVFCLPTATSYTCACDSGDTLGDDKRTCPGEFLCDKAFNQVNSNDVRIFINESCLLYVGEVCSFKCSAKYQPKANSDGPLTCTPGGWDRQLSTLCEAIYCPSGIANGQWTSGCDRMAGKSCEFQCNAGYRAISNKATCSLTGQWKEDTSTLCSPKICINPLKNAALASNCARSNGTTCTYKCNSGYLPAVNAPRTLTCNIDGRWNSNTDVLCEAKRCPSTIANGNISAGCDPIIGAVCTFTCATGSYKQASLSSLTCLPNLTWDTRGQTPCSAICTSSQFKCDSSHDCIDLTKVCDRKSDCTDKSDEKPANCTCPATIPLASLRSNCNRYIGTSCSFACDVGYRNTTDQLTCQRSTKTWNSAKPCTEIFCPNTISNGNMNKTCDRKVNSNCAFYCGGVFDKNPAITSIMCLNTGLWNQSTGLCLSQIAVTSPQKSHKGAAAAGIAVGVILLVIIVALAVAFVIFRKRLGFFKKDSPYSTASFSNASRESVAIENPGYMSADLQVSNDMDEPYINTAMQEMPYSGVQYPIVDPNDVDPGISNPLYFNNQEPLAGDSEISGPNSDHAVLTTDSWLKEQVKGPDDASNNNQ